MNRTNYMLGSKPKQPKEFKQGLVIYNDQEDCAIELGEYVKGEGYEARWKLGNQYQHSICLQHPDGYVVDRIWPQMNGIMSNMFTTPEDIDKGYPKDDFAKTIAKMNAWDKGTGQPKWLLEQIFPNIFDGNMTQWRERKSKQ